jgi:vacuolar-type H+-ATPase subunit I/STV1
MLPPIQSVHFQSHPRSSHAPTEQPSTEIDNIRQELNAMNDKLTELDRKLNYKLTKDEHRRQTNSKKSSAIDKQQTDHLKQISILIEELQNRILILETSSHPLPTELSQQATDQTTKINEKQTTDTQHIIEKLVGDLDDKIKQIEIQLTQILARSERIPDPNTYVDIIQPIQNDANNTPQSQLDNNEWRNLEPEAINKVNHLETQYNQFFQSTEDNTPRFALEESVISTGLLHQKLVSKASNASRNGFDNLDHPSNTIPSSSNLALENGSGNVNDNCV